MADSFRTIFGDTRCELGVHAMSDDTFVGWALEVRAGGDLVPVQDKHGALVLVKGTNAASVLDEVRARVSARFGVERSAQPKV